MSSRWHYFKRKLTNALALSVAVGAMGVGLFFLACIFWTLIKNGLPALTFKVFGQNTPPPGQEGGLLNALFGTLLITATGTLIGTPTGILIGTYLAEFRATRLASLVRLSNGLLLSAPSVIIGFFVYALVVTTTGHFSGWAGALALALIQAPIVVNATETMLLAVPHELREAAAALGAPQWRTTLTISYRAAKSGILTGVLLGIARIGGESAPLLFTALNNQFWSARMDRPMANLPVTIFQFAMSPYEDWQKLAWAGALLITLAVLGLNILARVSLKTRTGSR